MKNDRTLPGVLTLDRLPPGAGATVVSVAGREEWRLRLLDLGLTPGTVVRVVRTAPSGDPIGIRLRGYGMTLRREDARRITVTDAVRADGKPLER